LLFIELVQLLFWFNPLLLLYKRSIKLNHEFLADRVVLRNNANLSAYQNLLLAFSSNVRPPSLANAINYSFIKKRFTVMKKQTSPQAIWLRSLLILPLVAFLLYGFSTKEIIQKEILQEENVTGNLQEKASPEMVKEYNVIAEKWNDPNATNFKYVEGEKERALYIYSRMSESQKKESEPFPIRITELLESIPASPTPPSPPFPENLTALIEDIRNKNGVFFYGNEKISYKQALEIAKSKGYKGSIRTNYGKKIPELYLLRTEDSQISPPPPVPPTPPAPTSVVGLIEDMQNKNAVFIYNSKEISAEEALDIAKNKKINSVSSCVDKDGKYEVVLFSE